MANEMTKEWLKAYCKEQGYYTTPSLNDKLFLHFKGFDRIQNLEAYTGLKSLFLEGNGLEEIEGLEQCKELRCLFAQQNMIFAISPGLPESLSTLNVSNNNISVLENLAQLPDLQTLQASHCKLKDLDSIRELVNCKALSCVDLQQNKIDGDPEEMVSLFASMPALACLYLQGNPVVSSVRQYRKRMISSIPTLSYLDDRPVFPLERICAEAWAQGGLEAEKAARKAYKDAEEAKQKRDHDYLSNMREEARARREQLALEGKRAMLDVGMDSDGEWEPEEEPPELVAARARLAQFEARPGEEEPPELTKARAEAAAGSGDGNEAGAGRETREWQSLDGGVENGGCGAGGGCEPSSCAGCGPTTTGETKKAGRAAEEQEDGAGEAASKENDVPPVELNIEPLDIKFGSSVTIVKHNETEEALDELD